MRWYHIIPIVIAAVAIAIQVFVFVDTGISAQHQIDINNIALGR